VRLQLDLSGLGLQTMPPKRSITLTPAELRLMRVLWNRGESTVAEMVSATMNEGELAYTSVLTTIRVLETKGFVSHRQEGRAFLYSSCVGEQEAGRSNGSLGTRGSGCC